MFAALLGVSPVALADPARFGFSGSCLDCTGTGRGELVLADYAPGQAVTRGNFVSFHYDGTDLIAPFTITNVAAGSYGGSLSGGAAGNLFLTDGDHFFLSLGNGDWFLGQGSRVADIGTAGTYAPRQVSVPEPFSTVLLLAGAGGTLLVRGRRPA